MRDATSSSTCAIAAESAAGASPGRCAKPLSRRRSAAPSICSESVSSGFVIGGPRKKPRAMTGLFRWRKEPSALRRLDRHGGLAVGPVRPEFHLAGLEREQRVVLADADVGARVELGAALANDDRARVHELA